MATGGGVSGAGIFGESFHGIPLRAFAAPGAVCDPAGSLGGGSGGKAVRAVSRGSGSRATGGGSGIGIGAGFTGSGAGAFDAGAAAPLSSLPHPRQNL